MRTLVMRKPNVQRILAAAFPWLVAIAAIFLINRTSWLDLATRSVKRSIVGQQQFCQWGTYRPFPYVGLRCRSPHSPLVGLMWYKPSLLLQTTKNNTSSTTRPRYYWDSTLRHECAYQDELSRFGWNVHDGSTFGAQLLVDPTNQVKLTTEWIVWNQTTNQWVLRVSGERHLSGNILSGSGNDLSLLLYVATPGNRTAEFVEPSSIQGIQPDVGPFRIRLEPFLNTTHPSYWNSDTNENVSFNASAYFVAWTTDPSVYYNPKPNLISELQDPTVSLPSHLFDPNNLYRAHTAKRGNQVVLQVFFELPFVLDIHFAYQKAAYSSLPSPNPDSVTRKIDLARRVFHDRFEEYFQSSSWTTAQVETAQYALSNMLGSQSYMYGDRQLLTDDGHVVSQGPTYLFAIVPDRPNHAQGFAWDEGFHQHLVSLWDPAISYEIVSSWFQQVDNSTGWIARQQMLGEEVRWGARPSSWPQIPGTANPPTLHLLLETLLDRADANEKEYSPEFRKFLRDIWNPLQKNVDWYLETQQSPLSRYLFRWQGRTPTYCLPSGMDDYPRAPILTNLEAHLDLQVWMIVSTRVAARVASVIGDDEKAHFYERTSFFIQSMLDEFWNPKTLLFDEFYYTINSTITKWDGHFGYLNFFPFIFKVLPTDCKVFDLVTQRFLKRQNNGIWSDFGIRSLSTNDSYYRKGAHYWTGPIWININYMILRSLHDYWKNPRYSMSQTTRDLIEDAYRELRDSVIDTVVSTFAETGFIWEVYSGDTGAGFNNHPFTGWSALIVNIISERY